MLLVIQYMDKMRFGCNVMVTGPTNHRLHVIQSYEPVYMDFDNFIFSS